MDIAREVRSLLEAHPAVRSARLAGSRVEGRAHPLSDWDFVVETDDFAALESDLPRVIAPLRPLAEQWDPYSDYGCYMLMLPGPTKIDLLFPAQRRAWSPAWSPSPDTLEAIDCHFWDWILWLEQKRRSGRSEVVAKSLQDLSELLLRPLGVETDPRSIADALDSYLGARGKLEQELGVRVSRVLEDEVLPAVRPAATHEVSGLP